MLYSWQALKYTIELKVIVSGFLFLKKRVIIIYITIICLLIELILLTTNEMTSYYDTRHFFRTVAVLTPLLYN